MIKWQNCEFIQGIMQTKSFVKLHLPQLIFLGRSNVGKSSLINKILNHKGMAKTSKKPGKTQEINLFTVDKRIHLLDFPGYGYAIKSESKKNLWGDLFEHYIKNDYGTKLVCILIDSKVGKKDSDHKIVSFMNYYTINYIEIYTKADKIKEFDNDKIYVSNKFKIDNLKNIINTKIFESY